MDVLGSLGDGFASALGLQNLLLALVGVTVGTLVGVLPGLGPATTVALLLPITFVFDSTGALVLFAGIYYGGMYGGSTTAILLNVPGETASVPTTLEGHRMAKTGRAGAALATAAVGSFVAGTISTVVITFLAPGMSAVAKQVQPAEYFAIITLAFVTVTSLIGDSVIRGLSSLFLGLTVGLVGIDSLTGQARYSFGASQLYDGIPVVALAVGLFAIAEVLFTTCSPQPTEQVGDLRGKVGMTGDDWRRSWRPWLRGTSVGLPFGAMPAGGAEIPTFLSFNIERRLARRRKLRGTGEDEFGTGAIEGVAGPEAANNAAFSGVLIPLLTLGIPTSATAGVLLIAFQMYNIQPGPELFDQQAALVWTLIASLYIGNVMLLVLNFPMIRLWVKLLRVPAPVLSAGILCFALLGVYALSQSTFEMMLAIGLAVIGLFMRRTGYPIAPLILGAVLGPLMEAQYRRALAFSEGDPTVFLTRPASAAILTLALVALVGPVLIRLRNRDRNRDHRLVGVSE